MSSSLTIRLDPALAKALAEEAHRTRRPRGEVVRHALTEHLERRRSSGLDAFGDAVGCMSGPADLSSNRKHLAGLGRRKSPPKRS